MKNLMVTGGAGFIGLNVLEYYAKKSEYKITVFDDLSVGNYDLMNNLVKKLGLSLEDNYSPSNNNVFFFKGDIKNKKDIEAVMPYQDYVVHLAGKTGVLPSVKNPEEDAMTNIFGTLNLLRSSVKNGIRKFIFASSGATLGEQEPPLDENGISRPLSPYGASKLACEGYCSAFFHSYKLSTVVLRFSSVYGKYSMNKKSLIANLIKNFISGKEITVNGDGNQTRDFLYAGDIPKLISQVLEKNFNDFEIFQLGTGEETSVNDIIMILKRLTEDKLLVKFKEEKDGEIKRNYTSIKKYISYFGFSPEMELQEGVKETLGWFRKNIN